MWRVVVLPIAERELRVSARKRVTFWVRIVGAAVAVLVGAVCFYLTVIGPGFGTNTMGRGMFMTLTWLAFAAAIGAGLFLTSDSLSEEKREGTLGFLFLTDLRGSDVVIGKLAAAGLRGLYGMLAMLPVLAVTLLMGGVTGMTFFKTSLALMNALLASLAAGLFVSAISRHSPKALAGTLALLVLWVATGPVIDAVLARFYQRAPEPLLSFSSPGYLFLSAHSWGQMPFWWALLANQLLTWTLVALSGVLVPRTWQDNPSVPAQRPRRGARKRGSLRRVLLDVNPVTWIASLDRWPANALWGIAIVAILGALATFTVTLSWAWMVSSYVGSLLSLVVYLFVALQAARFLVEARRSGLLELLLATPLTERQIVHGQWRALLRMFAIPLALFMVAQGMTTFMAQQQTFAMTAAAAAATPPPVPTNAVVTTNVAVVIGPSATIPGGVPAVAAGSPHSVLVVLLAAGAAVSMLFALASSMWFGMWMGLTSKSTTQAALKTMFWVHILPWFCVGAIAGMLISVVVFAGPRAIGNMIWFTYLTSLLSVVLYAGINIFYCRWARRKLYSELRARALVATGQGMPVTRTGQ